MYENPLKMKAINSLSNNLKPDIHLRNSYLTLASQEGVWDYHIETKSVYYNEQMFQLFGFSIEEMNDNNTWWQLNIHPTDSLRVLTAFDELLNGTHTNWQGYYRFKTKAGEYIPVFERIYVVRDKKNRPLRLVGSMMDTSFLAKIEENLAIIDRKEKKILLKKVIESDTTEKMKIAYELNENINQVLAAVNMKIDHLKNYTNKSQINQINEIKDLLNESISDIRAINRKLYPTGLNHLGLHLILEEELRYLKKQTGINYHLKIDEKVKNVNHDYLLIIYHIQEKIELIREVGTAKNVNISILCFMNKTLLSFTDDGKYNQLIAVDLTERFSKSRLLADVYDFRLEIKNLDDKGSELEFEV